LDLNAPPVADCDDLAVLLVAAPADSNVPLSAPPTIRQAAAVTYYSFFFIRLLPVVTDPTLPSNRARLGCG
jgi:hypothetical protein